ncbi:hypothetical protein KSP39_PZI014805 [Platanthera zijinensis]|uniref:Uncharacterized protein n=1 Tax=Platanthera zijinensis TaxID=2320716 RepID=A0AAP0B9V6_9ASPA
MTSEALELTRSDGACNRQILVERFPSTLWSLSDVVAAAWFLSEGENRAGDGQREECCTAWVNRFANAGDAAFEAAENTAIRV